MTEQPPSAGALHVAETFVDTRERWFKLAHRIDSLCEQRVFAERERLARMWFSEQGEGYIQVMLGEANYAPVERSTSRGTAMTEQPSSASKEALDLAERIRDWQTAEGAGAAEIDALIARRVSAAVLAEQTRCARIANDARRKYRDMDAFIADEIYQDIRGATVGRAPAERPAPEGPQQSGDIVRWGVLRLLSGDLASNEEKVDAELDLDDFQFWFQENPKHTGFKQILINLSGEQWGKLKELPLVEERSRYSPHLPSPLQASNPNVRSAK